MMLVVAYGGSSLLSGMKLKKMTPRLEKSCERNANSCGYKSNRNNRVITITLSTNNFN